jgi:hypothetical protein
MFVGANGLERTHPMGDFATCPIARFLGRLAALLLVAGNDHAPRCALSDSPKTTHLDTFN